MTRKKELQPVTLSESEFAELHTHILCAAKNSCKRFGRHDLFDDCVQYIWEYSWYVLRAYKDKWYGVKSPKYFLHQSVIFSAAQFWKSEKLVPWSKIATLPKLVSISELSRNL